MINELQTVAFQQCLSCGRACLLFYRMSGQRRQSHLLSPGLMLNCCCADRVFGILKENNPELTGEKRRTIVKPPQVGP